MTLLRKRKGKVSGFEYGAFIVAPHTQGAQARITVSEFYPQITPYERTVGRV